MSEALVNEQEKADTEVALFDPFTQLFASNTNHSSFFKGLEGAVSSVDLIDTDTPLNASKRRAA
jgi:hypothetical protein